MVQTKSGLSRDCEKALFSATWGIQRYRNIICGAPIILETCHKVLAYRTCGKIREGKVTSSRIANWVLAAEGPSLEVKYAKNKNIVVAQGMAELHDCTTKLHPEPDKAETFPKPLPPSKHFSFSHMDCMGLPAVYVDGSAHQKTGTLGTGAGLVWASGDKSPQKFKLGVKSSQYAELAGTLIAVEQAVEDRLSQLVVCTDS